MTNDEKHDAGEQIRAVLIATGFSHPDRPSPVERRMVRAADPEAWAEVAVAFKAFQAGFAGYGMTDTEKHDAGESHTAGCQCSHPNCPARRR